MSKRFMKGTPLQWFEREMMLIPGFFRRKKKEEFECQHCRRYKKHKPCMMMQCPFLHDRLENGEFSLEELAMSMYRNYPDLQKRLKELDHRLTFFHNEFHRMRWDRWNGRFHYRVRKNKAALYLLAAYSTLWEKVYWHMDEQGFDFHRIYLGGVDMEEYAVYQAAKTILEISHNITVHDLASPDEVSDEVFSLVTEALLISGFGDDVMQIK